MALVATKLKTEIRMPKSECPWPHSRKKAQKAQNRPFRGFFLRLLRLFAAIKVLLKSPPKPRLFGFRFSDFFRISVFGFRIFISGFSLV
jgi:hypothetical protein